MSNYYWVTLSQSGHRFGILHMLDDSLAIFGGFGQVKCKYLNKVTTYNSDTNSWYSYYPDMLKNLNLE